jgi:hypothetical protein
MRIGYIIAALFSSSCDSRLILTGHITPGKEANLSTLYNFTVPMSIHQGRLGSIA